MRYNSLEIKEITTSKTVPTEPTRVTKLPKSVDIEVHPEDTLPQDKVSK